ncbi:MAG: hypothetical protein IT289_09040 [Oligoflexia bacterium]|nr:hypothetical protein [Oligoflexia bacterium]
MSILIWQRRLLLALLVFLASPVALAQAPTGQPQDDSGLNPHFASMTKEASFICGEFLPNAIEGISELMTLCGGRFGMRLSPGTFLEPTFVSGAGKGQRYTMGSLSIRSDYALDDFIGSMFAGGDIHYATAPNYLVTPTGEETRIYAGFHVGGAIWWELNDVLYLRTDLKFNFNPGNSMLVMLGIVMRFDPASQNDQGNQ